MNKSLKLALIFGFIGTIVLNLFLIKFERHIEPISAIGASGAYGGGQYISIEYRFSIYNRYSPAIDGSKLGGPMTSSYKITDANFSVVFVNVLFWFLVCFGTSFIYLLYKKRQEINM